MLISIPALVVAVIGLWTPESAATMQNSGPTYITYESADGAPGGEPATENAGDSKSCGDAESTVTGGWGPDRPSFVMLHPPTYTTLNAIRDNPQVGDERGFMRVRDAVDGATYNYRVEVQRDHVYDVSIFFENSALDNEPALASTDTKLTVNLPTCTGERIAANAFISGPAAFPGKIWGGITFTSPERFNLSYVAGSARIITNAHPQPGKSLPEDLFTSTGVLLGYDELDGVLQTGYQYSGYVNFQVRPQFAP